MNVLVSAALRDSALGRSRLGSRLVSILDLYRSRRALAQLDDARLDDIGLTRDRAEAEARRPIWDVPHTWLR